jgi:hypothetical protein
MAPHGDHGVLEDSKTGSHSFRFLPSPPQGTHGSALETRVGANLIETVFEKQTQIDITSYDKFDISKMYNILS